MSATSQQITFANAKASAVAAIREARENVQYWKRQQVLRERPDAKADAGARVLVWQSTLQAREQALENLLIPTTH